MPKFTCVYLFMQKKEKKNKTKQEKKNWVKKDQNLFV